LTRDKTNPKNQGKNILETLTGYAIPGSDDGDVLDEKWQNVLDVLGLFWIFFGIKSEIQNIDFLFLVVDTAFSIYYVLTVLTK
jgi:hypothetical protein